MHVLKRSSPSEKEPVDPAVIVRRVIDACADCDTCRFLMNEDCLFFPALYRLVDREAADGRPCSGRALRGLVELCSLCGLCPCPDIRNDVIRAKSGYVRESGMAPAHRLMADVQRLGRICGMAPDAVNAALSVGPVHRMVSRLAGIHPRRRLPRFPQESFFSWARRKGLCRPPENGPGVAYFAGCTAGYLFPEVARAAVRVLQHSQLKVMVPPQQCCGMPTLVEGDAALTRRRVQANLDALLAARRMGFDPVCSCPTCGFLMKVLMKEGACHSNAYQQSVGAAANEIKIPDGAGGGRFLHLSKSLYAGRLRDDGLFSDLDPMDRLALSEGVADMGQYLLKRLDGRHLDVPFQPIAGRMAYFAPCHQREQKIGSPYVRLLALIPGLTIEPVGGPMDCCGMGGSLGYKKSFHDASVSLGAGLMQKIRAAAPQAVITDCLSCRLQFRHLLPFPVFHPLELLARACEPG
ncbi:sn-glycerol-3-phosphate dehydrogenase subunit C [Desulfosarcina alkanivorans]|uniref:sn-glycerol-3-phosphate dehydrogenase subunit C n=1 Tax=Desulfosarcina alkanivorans TaxID=571177 RepID=A0A5K7YV85_9BACT|nr:heterodisulfide reductase-related iron-sulfur binding cluster [Desulfosarcina alkanivorans]BBO72325.1 sn-glycerol-3-phosphate dehydrogenase subunit C [Desulfosarcina alkanivorans]